MKNINNNILDLTLFSKSNITFLSDQIKNKNLIKKGYYHFFKIHNLEINILKNFLSILESKKAYVILPLLTVEEKLSTTPIVTLSNQILVTKESDPLIIYNFLLKQIDEAFMNYGFDSSLKFTVILKFRSITLKEDTINQVSNLKYSFQEKYIPKNITMMNSKYYNGSIIPLSMNLNFYGDKLNILLSTFYIFKFDLDPNAFFFFKGEFVIYIKIKNEFLHEGILFKNKEIVFKFEDNLIGENKFTRITDKFKIYIENFKILYFDRLIKNSFITSSKSNRKLNTQIVTFDIETYVKDGQFIPFACGWYEGSFERLYYLTDYNSPYDMLLNALTEMLDFNPNSKVYIHNFSNFDYLFLIKVLFNNFKIKPFFKDGKVINLIYQHKDNNNYKLELFDSYLILPSSLRTLALKYKVNTLKGYFPYKFVNELNLNYVGPTPDITFFNDISKEEYQNEYTNSWNLKNKLLEYLSHDLKSLHEVITIFARDIYNVEKVDIGRLSTNSAISLKIFRTNYLGENKLPIIKGIVHKEIRNSYYGGVVEVFRNEGTNLNYYDVTSLYPFAMLNDMPTGDMVFSTDSNLNNYFGIVFVEVDTSNLDSKYLNYPLLPHKIDGRLYNPLGKWSGWYFSEEVKLAQSYGYFIKVLYGYKFNKTSNVFTSFIKKYFNIKAGLSNINMDRTTAKLLVNSLYGRLGMKPYQDIVEIIDRKRAQEILSKYIVKEQYNITDEIEFIRYENKPIHGFEELYGKDEYLNFMLECDSKNISINQSLPCAIATTAYARMYMFKIIYMLIDLGIDIFYMDTDSIVINGILPPEFIGNKLGLFKLEHEIEHAYFISPKLYAFKTKDDKTIIKAKGIGSLIDFTAFETLINNKNIVKAQERWFKDPVNANINIKNIDMHISSINLKRRQIMVNNKLSHTLPLVIDGDNIK